MAKGVLGWNNRAVTATLAVTSAQPALPASYLVDAHLFTKWRSTGVGGQNIDLDFGSSLPVGLIGLIGHNLTAAATWRITMDNASQSGSGVHDSTSIAIGFVSGFPQAIYLLNADVSARFVRIAIADAANPAGYMEAGALFVGPTFRPGNNFSFGRAFGWVDPSVRSKSKGGQLYVDLRPRYRTQEFEFKGLSQAEIFNEALEMDRQRGVADNVLFVPDYNSSFLAREALWGPIVDATPAVHVLPTNYSKRYRMEERL
jgi:hypothetical protein